MRAFFKAIILAAGCGVVGGVLVGTGTAFFDIAYTLLVRLVK